MSIVRWFLSIFFKTLTLGKIDLARDEQLSKVLMLLRRTSKQDWTLERNVRVVKDTIYHEKYVGDDFFSDGFCLFYMPRYEIDESQEPTKIYETYPYFFNLGNNKGFMMFRSSDDVFCKGEIIGVINEDTVFEEIDRSKAGIDADLLDFFDDLRMHFREG